jgi:dinuclear metal center YbgI/SA1388 family protein
VRLPSVVHYLDELLAPDEFPGDASLNGLQVEGSRRVERIALAVDACETSIRRAVRLKADILIVHHGLFWGETRPLTGILARRVGLLLTNGLSLYAAHLPLDAHAEIGNNARLAALLSIAEPHPFGRYRGAAIGLYGRLPREIGIRSLAAALRRKLGSRTSTFSFGPPRIRTLGIVSGGGAFLAQEAARRGCDALLTGETSHSAYHTAREAKISLVHAGHYATETLGLKALGARMRADLGLPAKFIDVPTGL